ncbi:MAG: FxsA family protein [Deltaproteobacteria bacterium]|nr:FxsA family protein [Deltaproteobacteria bacterium]RLC11910.1 MAG: membrane protein FxsA [Deltaproteobacteria bacterium]
MFVKLLLGFILIPFIELYLLIKIGQFVGAFNTIFIVIFTGIAGAYLARLEGIRTLFKVRESLNSGKLPAEEMLDAMLIFVAGAVLLTPGFITDLAGILILIPRTRYWFKRWLRKKFDQWISQNRINITTV